MKFDHKNKNFWEAIGVDKSTARLVYKDLKEIMFYVDNEDGFHRSELIEFITNKIDKQNSLETALMFEIVIMLLKVETTRIKRYKVKEPSNIEVV